MLSRIRLDIIMPHRVHYGMISIPRRIIDIGIQPVRIARRPQVVQNIIKVRSVRHTVGRLRPLHFFAVQNITVQLVYIPVRQSAATQKPRVVVLQGQHQTEKITQMLPIGPRWRLVHPVHNPEMKPVRRRRGTTEYFP